MSALKEAWEKSLLNPKAREKFDKDLERFIRSCDRKNQRDIDERKERKIKAALQ